MEGSDTGVPSTDKDKIIETLTNEKEQLLLKLTELEETIEVLKAKSDSMEQRAEDLQRVNNSLRDQLDAHKPPRPTRGVSFPEYGALTPNSEAQGSGTIDASRMKKKFPPPPPPPVILRASPPPPPSPSSSSSSSSPTLGDEPLPPVPPPPAEPSSPHPESSPTLEITHEEQISSGQSIQNGGAGGGGGGGWAKGGWSSGTVDRGERGKARMSVMLKGEPHGSEKNNLDVTREERAKTSPIPAPSPSMVPPSLARAVSLSSPAFPVDPDTATPGTLGAPEIEETEEDDSPDLILAKNEDTGKTFVKAGTLDKLIERLTYHKTPETDYAIAFLLTYRSFTSPMELMDKLIGRYNLEPKDGLSTEALATFEKKKKIIQLRVGNVLKMWLDKHFHDFALDPELVARANSFVDTQISKDMDSIGQTCLKLLKNTRVAPTVTWNTAPPTSINPKTNLFIDFDPLEVARQLALIEYDLYKCIESKECLNQSWNKPDKEEKSPHIVAMIKRFNLVSTWVATEIVKTDKMADRVMVVKKFLNIAKHCKEIGNFNGIMEVLAGLQNSAIYRLKKTWEKVFIKAKYQDLYNHLLLLMSNNGNFRDYRAALHNVQPPCIPYLGVYLTDLTFIEDGTKNTLNGRDDLIHFEKRRKVSVVIRDIQQYQQTPYHLAVEETVREFLLHIEGLAEKSLYKYSMSCEPRETKDAAQMKREFSFFK